MNILVLGGTKFLGRHFVEIALERGHSLTLFNRRKSKPDVFENIETIVGDRNSDIDRIKGRHFDAVVDTCGYFPSNMRTVTESLKGQTGLYVFVSSCSVFDQNDVSVSEFDENGPLVDLNIDHEDPSDETYGARKFHCEEVVREVFKDTHLVVRPGLIVGPHDPTYRFPYWADRVAEGGEVLTPGDAHAPLQFIDARDLAEWILLGIEKNINGTFNTVSPNGKLTFGEFLQAVQSEINPACKFTWIPEKFLRENDVSCWSELPLWVYQESHGFLKVNSNRAIAEGLKFRPIAESIRDTHNWTKPIYKQQFLDKVLSREKEKGLLQNYVKHSSDYHEA